MDMKHLFFKSLLISLLVLFGGGGISAAEESITFSEKGYLNGELMTTVKGSIIRIEFAKGSNNNGPKYYDTGTAIRAYGGNFFTVTASDNTITKIVLGFGSSDGSNEITTDVVTYDNGTWTGTANSVKFTIGGSTGNRRLASISVTYTTETPSGEEEPNNRFAVEEDNATIGVEYTMPEFTTSSNGAKSYSSSNTDVATISNSGAITLLKTGTTTITVSTAQTATYAAGSASYILNVAKGTTELSFASESVTAYVGTDQPGPALTNPDNVSVKYEISEPEIAIIQSNGYIHPLKKGTALVTVTTNEPEAWNSASASYTLKVEEAFSVDAVGTYELVTSIDDLKDGDQVLIANTLDNRRKVLGVKNGNNANVIF